MFNSQGIKRRDLKISGDHTWRNYSQLATCCPTTRYKLETLTSSFSYIQSICATSPLPRVPILISLNSHFPPSFPLLSVWLPGASALNRSIQIFSMDFIVDNDANGEIAGNTAVDIARARDENEIIENSVEGEFEQYDDHKMDKESLAIDMIPDAVPAMSMVAADEPYLGQEFDSEASAHAFYNAYATRIGFVIRVSKLSRSRRDGSAIGRALVCNKEGFRMPDKREKIVRQRAETRVGCRAMILVRKVSSGKWVVTKFVKEHTHPLTPGKGRRDCIYDQYPNEHDKIRELSQQLAIEKKRAATYKRHLELIFEQIEEHNDNLSKKIQHIVDSMRGIENEEQQSQT